jgi:hypothetical protein
MPVTFPVSQFACSNILIFDSQSVGRAEFISNVKDADAVVIEDGDAISNNMCVDTIKTAGYRQIIMGLKDCKSENKYVLPFDYIVVFNNKHMGWRDDIYYTYSLQRAFEDFEEFAQTLDKLEDYECLVISASEGSARRLAFRRG